MVRDMSFLTRNHNFFIDLPMKFVISEKYDQSISSFLLYQPLMSFITVFFFLDKAMRAKKRAVSQPARVSTRAKLPATPILLHRIRPQLCRLHRYNHLFMTQKRLSHSGRLVQDPREAQRKQRSLSLLWMSPS